MISLVKCTTPSLPSSLVSPFLVKNPFNKTHLNSINISESRKFNDLKPTPISKAPAGGQTTLVLFNLCLQMCVNARSMEEARVLFDEMPERSLVSWTVLMSGYAKHGPVYEALVLFQDMMWSSEVVMPDSYVYAVVLRACGEVEELGFGQGVHGLVLKTGDILDDGYVENALVNMYSSCGSVSDAVDIFDMIEKPDLVAWSSIINVYVKNGFDDDGLETFLDMIRNNIELDAFVFSSAIKACTNTENDGLGGQIHCRIVKTGFVSHSFLGNSLVDFYAKCGDLKGSRQVFDQISDKDLVSWNTLIAGYVHNSHYLKALEAFIVLVGEVCCCDDFTIASVLKAVSGVGNSDLGKQVHGYLTKIGLGSNHYVMHSLLEMYTESIDQDRSDQSLKLYINLEGGECNGFIIAAMLKQCSLQLDLETGQMFHALVVKHRISSDPFIVHSLVDLYSKCGIPEASLRIFERSEGPNTVVWSALVSGFTSNGYHTESLNFFREMQFLGVEANDFTFTSALLACLALDDLERGKEVHCKILRNGYGSNHSVINMLMNLYLGLGRCEQALNLSVSDTEIPWTLLTEVYLKAGDYEMVHEILRRIQLSRSYFDPNCASDILESCENPVFLTVGTQAQAHMTKSGILPNAITGNALIKMYAECGKVADANLAFRLTSKNNPTVWTSIISANVAHGHPFKGLNLFRHMQWKSNSVEPSTLKAVLKGFSLVGHVHEANRLFMTLEEVYGIKPSEEHYSYIVESLGRAGMFDTALDFIKTINRVKVGTLIWTTLLSACRLHSNIKVAIYALQKLLELDPGDSSAHQLLKHVSVMSGIWENKSDITLQKNPVMKNSSSILVRNKIYDFVSGEEETWEIKKKIAEIEAKMKELQYQSSRNNFFCIEEEEYDGFGLHHTEMKAIVFGLISLPRGMPIIVTKNERMHGNSHSACKFMSTFIDQELVVKDLCSFHHFRDGSCSCGDLW